jgi:probable rRNA maturation factor
MSSNLHFETTEELVSPVEGNEDRYISWLTSVARNGGRFIEHISYIFCSDDYLLDMNIRYLGHDYYTDIITFPYDEGDQLSGDMFISVDRVRDNAAEYGVDFETELRRVMVHGLLHLMGYSDKTDEDVSIMRAKEDLCLQMFDQR